jgi:hypothetical protein
MKWMGIQNFQQAIFYSLIMPSFWHSQISSVICWKRSISKTNANLQRKHPCGSWTYPIKHNAVFSPRVHPSDPATAWQFSTNALCMSRRHRTQSSPALERSLGPSHPASPCARRSQRHCRLAAATCLCQSQESTAARVLWPDRVVCVLLCAVHNRSLLL